MENITKAEFDQRLTLAQKYGGFAGVIRLREQLLFGQTPEQITPTFDCFDLNLQKSGLEVATESVEGARDANDRLNKRRSNPEIDKLMRRMAAHDGPPTKEEIAEMLKLTAAPGEDVSDTVAKLLAGTSVTKRYTPTEAEIAKDDELLMNSAGL